MATTVSQMTVLELRNLIGEVIEEKLSFLIDEDEMEITDELRERLVRQKKQIENGDRGTSMEDVMTRLGLN